MKTSIVFILLVPLLMNCSTTSRVEEQSTSQRPGYGHFFDLAAALRQEPGLLVTGFGRNVNIRSRRSQQSDLLYMVNGMEVGHDYNAVNDLINMDEVVSIRVGINLTHRTVTGKSNAGGIVEINTR
ncbi:MAG: hypothetical protein HKN76_19870 [Saprospiraceae bacterium]|nr:hypothetical protein [Saprospiraceae bacterium]